MTSVVTPGLYAVPVGSVDVRNVDIFGRGDGFVDLPVISYVLVRDGRITVVDTGCSIISYRDAGDAWGKVSAVVIPHAESADPLGSGLTELGIDKSAVTDVVLTHLHMDHSGGLRDFPNATIWIQKQEFRWALYPHSYFALPYVADEFDPSAIQLSLVEGDTSISDHVRTVLTAGHTPGHQSVLLQAPNGRWYGVVGDALYTRQMLDRGWRSGAMWNAEEWWNARCRLETLETVFGTELLFPHDPAGLRDPVSPWRVDSDH